MNPRTARDASAVRVSVVMPVFNPGLEIEPGIRSILDQTMPAGQVEAIFVDDGSTDGTPARLDRLAADHAGRLRVIHIPPSGAPGRPRNVGLDAAVGEYVQFLDSDDELAPDALERLVAMADRNGSDVVIEKFASASLQRSQVLFARTIESCTLAERPDVIDSSMGPAKLFRRAFLRDQGILFPEGWRRMEDQYLVLRSYIRASVISVLAEYPCYFYRQRSDGQHLTSEPIDPVRHARNLAAILDMVAGELPPGPLRDRIVQRLIRIEVLARISEPWFLELDSDDRGELLEALRGALVGRVDPGVVAGLGAIGRLRHALLSERHDTELVAVAERMADLKLTTRLERASWLDGALTVRAAAKLAFEDGRRPLVLLRRGARSSLDPTLDQGLTGASLDVTADVARRRIDVVLRSRADAVEWYARSSEIPSAEPVAVDAATPRPDSATAIPVASVTQTSIDLLRIGAGTNPVGAGTWDVLVRFATLGIIRMAPLGVARSSGAAGCRPALLGDPVRVIVPILDPTGLRLEVDPGPDVLAGALRTRRVRVIRDGRQVVLGLDMAAGPGAGTFPASLVIRAAAGDRVIDGILRPMTAAVVFAADVAGLEDLRPGWLPAAIRLGGADAPAEIPLGSARIVGPTELRFEDLDRQDAVVGVILAVRERLARQGRAVRRGVGAGLRRLPARPRRRLRQLAGRFR